jgi:hypothetical protein
VVWGFEFRGEGLGLRGQGSSRQNLWGRVEGLGSKGLRGKISGVEL